MKEAREFEGVDIEAAVAAAAEELGVPAGELEYEVAEAGAKGFLGVGGRPARVVVTVPTGKRAAVPSRRSDQGKGGRESVEQEVKGFLEEVLERMRFKLHVRLVDKGEYLFVELSGQDRDEVLQNRAELLEVFQYLLNRVFGRRLGGRRLVADCDGFRERKEQELREIARRASERVKLTGMKQQLGLLNAYERRVVHLAVAEQEGVTSASSGEGLLKRITIMPSDS
ncbi:MAG: protein jag [Acidobacteriota bacterium]